MYIIDGIAYAGVPSSELEIAEFTPTGNLTAIVRFNTGEERIMDATMLLDMPHSSPWLLRISSKMRASITEFSPGAKEPSTSHLNISTSKASPTKESLKPNAETGFARGASKFDAYHGRLRHLALPQ